MVKWQERLWMLMVLLCTPTWGYLTCIVRYSEHRFLLYNSHSVRLLLSIFPHASTQWRAGLSWSQNTSLSIKFLDILPLVNRLYSRQILNLCHLRESVIYLFIFIPVHLQQEGENHYSWNKP